MNKYTDVTGIPFTDADVERWADEAEAGFPQSDLVSEQPIWVTREPMETHSIRVPAALWAQVRKNAKEQNISASEYARQALYRGLAS